MKPFPMILVFLLIFFFFLFAVAEWFPGLTEIKYIFSLTIAALVCLVAFGIIDVFLPAKKKEDQHHH